MFVCVFFYIVRVRSTTALRDHGGGITTLVATMSYGKFETSNCQWSA